MNVHIDVMTAHSGDVIRLRLRGVTTQVDTTQPTQRNQLAWADLTRAQALLLIADIANSIARFDGGS